MTVDVPAGNRIEDSADAAEKKDNTPPETVTMMIYMNGSDLESSSAAGTKDMGEMLESGMDLSRINLLVYTGGAAKWHSDVPAEANALFRLGENGFEEIERFEDASMGDPGTLAQFLEYGYAHYPADTYDLILWDHGNGPVMGYGIDRRHGGDSLTLPELREALEQSPFGKEQHLGIIGFDACLMASAELACTVADYADYLVSSQETEPNFGWNYGFLAECGEKSSRETAEIIVSDYIQYCDSFFEEKAFFRSDVTLSVFDLSRAEELGEALDAIFKKAADDVSGDYNLLAAERVRSRALGRASTGSEYDLVDVDSLMGQMAESYPQEAARVREILSDAVIFSKTNAQECCGISLFYPCFNKNYYKASWKEGYRALGLFPSYLSYLERYDQIWLGTDFTEIFTGEMKPEKGKEASSYTLQLTEAQQEVYAQGSYYILRRVGEDVYYPVFASQDVEEKEGTLTASFDGRVLYGNSEDSEDFGFIPYTILRDKVGSQTEYSCPRVSVCRNDIASEEFEFQNCTILLSIDKETGDVTIKSIYVNEEKEENELDLGKQEMVDPDEWEDFLFRDLHGCYLTRDKDGRILPFEDWPEKGDFSIQEMSIDSLVFSYEQIVDDGYEYFVMFEIMDTQGNSSCSELLPVSLSESAEAESDEADFILGEDDTVTLLDEQGIVLSLDRSVNMISEISYYTLTAQNHNDFGVYLSLDDFIYDHQYAACDGVVIGMEPGESDSQSLPLYDYGHLADLLAFEGTHALDHVSFRLTNISRRDNDSTILKNRKFSIHFEGEKESGISPFLDAMAGRQMLYDESGLSVELLSLGRQIEEEPQPYISNSVLEADFLIQNLSAKPVKTGIRALRINGIEFSDNHRYGRTIRPENKWYTSISFEEKDLRNLGRNEFYYSEEEDRRLLRSISGIEVLLSVDDQYVWLPVSLDRTGTQDGITPAGNELYRDDVLSIYTSGIEGDVPGESMDPCLWYVNNSDRLLYCTCTLEGGDPDKYEDVLFSFLIGPGSTIVRDNPVRQDIEERYCIYWKEEGQDVYSVSGPFSY